MPRVAIPKVRTSGMQNHLDTAVLFFVEFVDQLFHCRADGPGPPLPGAWLCTQVRPGLPWQVARPHFPPCALSGFNTSKYT
jgi:hypothetical protein